MLVAKEAPREQREQSPMGENVIASVVLRESIILMIVSRAVNSGYGEVRDDHHI